MSDKKDDKHLFPVETSQWNERIERIIKETGESCKGYKWMHVTSAKIAMRNYNMLMYATICIGPLGGLIGTIASSSKDDESFKIFSIISVVCGFISGVLASIVKYSKYNQYSIDHKTAAAKYTSLEGNIRRQLALYKNDRVNAGKYFQWVTVSFDELFSGSPLIGTDIYQTWIKFAKINNLCIPSEYGMFVNIDSDGKIKDMCNIDTIEINNNNKSSTENESKNEEVHITIERNKTVRTDKYTPYSDFNRYDDPKMQYEMSRMFGFGKKSF